MAYGTKARFDAVREAAFGDITANYTAVGSALTDHARLIRFVNQTDAQIYISLDNSTDHIRMVANSFFILDFSSNKVRDDGLFVPVGTVFYVKRQSGAPSSGSFWIEVVSATGGV